MLSRSLIGFYIPDFKQNIDYDLVTPSLRTAYGILFFLLICYLPKSHI